MSDSPFERYKDALKRGHVAALRGRPEEALAAYDEARSIAPDRALPYTSRGTVLARLGRTTDALAAFDDALARAPGEPAALAGRAEALVAIGRPGDAAVAFDSLAGHHESAGRLADAVESGRRALDLAESRHRRRWLVDAVDRLAATSPGEAGEKVIIAARRQLEQAGGDTDRETGELTAAPMTFEPGRLDPIIAGLTGAADAALAAGDAGAARAVLLTFVAACHDAGLPEPPTVAGVRALAIDPDDDELHRHLATVHEILGWPDLADDHHRLLANLADRAQLAVDPAELEQQATSALVRGDASTAVRTSVALAASSRLGGHMDAAIDDLYAALIVAPDDPRLHLALAEVYEALGWTDQATEKLRLLERFVGLGDDRELATSVGRVAAVRFRRDASLTGSMVPAASNLAAAPASTASAPATG